MAQTQGAVRWWSMGVQKQALLITFCKELCGNERIWAQRNLVHKVSNTFGEIRQSSEVHTRSIGSSATGLIQPCLQQGHSATSTPVKRNILSCVVSDPPVGSTPFLPAGNASYPSYDVSNAQLPGDHYLWLVGQAGCMLRRKIEPTANRPLRQNQ